MATRFLAMKLHDDPVRYQVMHVVLNRAVFADISREEAEIRASFLNIEDDGSPMPPYAHLSSVLGVTDDVGKFVWERAMNGTLTTEYELTPLVGTSLRVFHQLMADYAGDLAVCINREVADVEGMWAKVSTDRSGSTYIGFDDDPRGAYYVAAGLRHHAARRPDQLLGWAWLSYTRSSPDGETHEVSGHRPIDINEIDPSTAKNAAIIGAMLVAAAREHHRSTR